MAGWLDFWQFTLRVLYFVLFARFLYIHTFLIVFYSKLMSSQNSPKNSKPPSGSLRGSMRPLKQASNQFHEPEDIKVPERNVSSKEKDSQDTHPLQDVELPSQPRQRTVSFNEDTMVNSFDGSKAPIEEPTVEWEVLKSIPVEEMTIDEMIEKVEEKGDIVEDSGNNYEVSLLINANQLVFVCSLVFRGGGGGVGWSASE